MLFAYDSHSLLNTFFADRIQRGIYIAGVVLISLWPIWGLSMHYRNGIKVGLLGRNHSYETGSSHQEFTCYRYTW
jgi:hypothetical protein